MERIVKLGSCPLYRPVGDVPCTFDFFSLFQRKPADILRKTWFCRLHIPQTSRRHVPCVPAGFSLLADTADTRKPTRKHLFHAPQTSAADMSVSYFLSADIRRHPQTSADTDKQRIFWVNPYGDVSASTFAARRLRRACRRSHAQRRHQRNSLMRFSRLETREVPCQDRQPFASKMQVVRQVHLIPTQLFTPGIRHFLVGSRNQRETM